MRTFDFAPLFRSTVGFDRLFDLLEDASAMATFSGWPPYDIVRTDEDRYRVVMAVAGLSPEDLEVVAEPGVLVVKGRRKAQDDGAEVLHRGLSDANFERRFELADYVTVAGASLDKGLLTIELVRELPEAMKPRRIPIRAQALPGGAPQPQVEHSSQKLAA